MDGECFIGTARKGRFHQLFLDNLPKDACGKRVNRLLGVIFAPTAERIVFLNALFPSPSRLFTLPSPPHQENSLSQCSLSLRKKLCLFQYYVPPTEGQLFLNAVYPPSPLPTGAIVRLNVIYPSPSPRNGLFQCCLTTPPPPTLLLPL